MENKRLERIPKKYRQRVGKQLSEISKIIQQRREELGYTQEELAEKLDISSNMLQFIEQERRYPSFPMLFYICSYLKISIKIGD